MWLINRLTILHPCHIQSTKLDFLPYAYHCGTFCLTVCHRDQCVYKMVNCLYYHNNPLGNGATAILYGVGLLATTYFVQWPIWVDEKKNTTMC